MGFPSLLARIQPLWLMCVSLLAIVAMTPRLPQFLLLQSTCAPSHPSFPLFFSRMLRYSVLFTDLFIFVLLFVQIVCLNPSYPFLPPVPCSSFPSGRFFFRVFRFLVSTASHCNAGKEVTGIWAILRLNPILRMNPLILCTAYTNIY